MKFILYVLTIMLCGILHAQITIKTEYIGQSPYKLLTDEEKSEQVGDSKGSAVVYQAGLNLPFSVKLNEEDQPTVWGVSMGYAYVRLYNRHFDEDLVADRVTNASLGIYHMRPMSSKWSYLATLGAGAFVSSTDMADVRAKDIIGQFGLVFIRHLKPGLDLGAGVAFNNSFGYPMVFPAFYLNWQAGGEYTAQVSMMQGLQASISYQMTDYLKLSYIAEVDGQLAFERRNGREEMFTHQYIITGVRSVFQIGDKLELPVTIGINAMRAAQYTERKLQAVFQADDNSYYFQVSPYASIGLTYKFF